MLAREPNRTLRFEVQRVSFQAFLLIAGLLLWFGNPRTGHAQDLYWDPSVGNSWDQTNSNWSDVPGMHSRIPWGNASNAVFSGAQTPLNGNVTVTLNDNVTVGNITYTGATSGSALQIATGTGNTLTMAGGQMQIATDPGTTLTLAPTIAGPGLLALTSGQVVLTGTNTYTGGTTIGGGPSSGVGAILSVASDAQLGGTGSNVTIQGGELVTTVNGFSTSRAITLVPGGIQNVLSAAADTTATYAGPITGSGELWIGDNAANTGTVVLTGANTYTGGTMVDAGATLSINADSKLGGPGGGLTLAGGELLSTADGFSTARPVNLANHAARSSALAAAAGTTATYTGVISGTGSLQVGDALNAGTVVLANPANSYTGGTAVTSGATLSVAADGALGASSGTVTLAGGGLLTTSDGFVTQRAIYLVPSLTANVLAAAAATTAAYQGIISGSGELWVGGANNSGTVVLQGANTYTGGTTINSGATLSVASDAALGGPAGNLVLNGGKLLTTGDGFTTDRDLTLTANGGTLVAATGASQAGTTATYTGVFSGAGQLTIGDGVNTGTVVLTGANTYAGGSVILPQSTLVAGSDTALGTGPAVVSGGTLQVPVGVTLSNPINFSAEGGVLENSGTLNTDVLDPPLGSETVINAGRINGSVRLGSASNLVTLITGSSISGDLDLGSNAGSTLVLAGAGQSTLTQAVGGTLTDAGSLVKADGGTWTLDADLTAPVETNLLDGVLAVEATLSSAQVNIESGATLTGNGAINGSVTNGGLLQPGSAGATGTLRITGDYLQTASGTYSVRLASADSYDRLSVGGHATLGGNLTWSTLGGFTPAAASTFTIITAAGGVSGSFASLTRPAGIALTLQVNGNTVTLSSQPNSSSTSPSSPTSPNVSSLPVNPNGTVTETFYAFPLFALNRNQLSVAEALQSVRFSSGVGTDLTNVISALTILSDVAPARMPAAFDELSPLAVPSFSTIAFTLETAQAAQLEQRLAAIRAGSQYELNRQPVAGSASDANGVALSDAGKQAGPPPKMVELAHGDRWGAFVTGSGTFAGVDRATDLLSYNFNTGGVTAGVDYRVTNDLAVGLYGGYAHTQADFDENNRLYVDGGKWGLYGTWRKGGFYVDGIVGGGYNSYDLRRGIDFVSRTARSNPESWEIDALGGVGYDWQLGPLTAGLNASLQYTHLDVQGFTEDGAGALDLQVSANHADSLRQYLGWHAYYTWRLNPNLTITPEADLAWQHEYLDGGRQINAGFQTGAGPGFVVYQARAPRDSGFGGTGVTVTYKNVSAYFFYNPEFGSDDIISHTISGGIRVTF